MKLKFDAALDYQNQAINAVVDLFEGQPIAQSNFEISASSNGNLAYSELGIGNKISLSEEQFLSNVHRIQEANNIQKETTLQGYNFSIEMETGTGKTYVYLRSIFELSKKYDLKKFIIVVPSVAIREGVLKSIEVMKEHFDTLYNSEPFNCFVYDSKKLGHVREFATNNCIQIMIINVQSFQKDVIGRDTSEMTEEELKKLNIINRENDKMSGYKPIEFIQATNPVVIIDEPQSVDSTPKAKQAITNLNPAVTLRYSATHRNLYNLLYKLDPIQAYDLRLVKQIEVVSVNPDEIFNDAYVKLLETNNARGIKARIEIVKQNKLSIKRTKIWVKREDDLFKKSGEKEDYREGYIVESIDCTPGGECIKFSNGKYVEVGQGIGGSNDEVMKFQVYETVEQHLNKRLKVLDKDIKILSLFFIDKVANYRIYNDDNSASLGKLGRWFEDAYTKLTSKPRYKRFAVDNISKIHNGYFSKDYKGRWKDSSERGSQRDNDTYNLIMRDKERLLEPEEPLSFIFSHSALREGWDNPNVFQICTLNESVSVEKKRQEIGRGLRLPVNASGERIHDDNINRLTVIANESYGDFAKALQNEFEEDCRIKFGHIQKTAFSKISRPQIEFRKERPIGSEESIKIWEKLRDRGYIDENGKILDKFNPAGTEFKLEIGEEYESIQSQIIDEMKRFIFENRVVDARKRKKLTFNKQVHLSADFQALWEKIKYRTRYKVVFETNELIKDVVERIKQLQKIKPARIHAQRVELDISDAGVSAEKVLEEKSHTTESFTILPDILAYLQKETELTRSTLAEILNQSDRFMEFEINPQQFMSLVAKEISHVLHNLIIEGIQYEKVTNHYWEMQRIEKEAEQGIIRYLNNLYEVQNAEKCLFNFIEFDSEVEKQFAKALDSNERVRLFIKLPSWFKIDTPIGSYNPDWAFVTERDEKLYFVRETKSTADNSKLRVQENSKISCAKEHFKTLDVSYDVVTKLSEVEF